MARVNVFKSRQTEESSVLVVSDYRGAGTEISSETATIDAQLLNHDSDGTTGAHRAIEYRVGSGEWRSLEAGDSASMDIDLATTSIFVRRPLQTESGNSIRIVKAFASPSLDIEDDTLLLNDVVISGAAITLSSNAFGLVGDNATDNNTAILAWIAAAQAIITAGGAVKMTLTPGFYQTTGRHVFPGEADIEFDGAKLIASGSDDTAPLFTHGRADALTYGQLTGLKLDSVVSHNYYNPSFIGLRLLNKRGAYHEITYCNGFYRVAQFQADVNSSAHNTLRLGELFTCKEYVNFNCASADSAYPSENLILNGNCQATSNMNNFGSTYGMTFTRDYETGGYTGHSGNFWEKPCFQLGNVGLTWSASATLTEGYRYYAAKSGGEWLCKTTGTSGTVEPSLLPAVVEITGITITAASAIATMASTASLSAGMHLRGTNPHSAFPLDTYISSVDSATQITLTKSAAKSSANYIGRFIAPTTDNTAVLVYLGPYRRQPVRHRGCGTTNGVRNARWESGVGEAVSFTGEHFYPQSDSSNLKLFKGEFHSKSAVVAKICQFPVWAATTAYAAGEASRPTVLATEYWECITAGTSGGSEPVSSATTPGTTFTDGSVTWLIRTLPDTDRADWNEYGITSSGTWNVEVGRVGETPVSSSALDNLHLRGIGSASGWLVYGACKCTTAGVLSQSFAASDFILSREGLLLNSTTAILGALVRTTKIKSFAVAKHFGSYSSSRFHQIPFGPDLKKLPALTAAHAYHRRIQSIMPSNGATEYNESSDGTDGSRVGFNSLIAPEVTHVFLGIVKGTTGTPVACAISGFSVREVRHRIDSQRDRSNVVQLSTPYSALFGARASLSTPTSGFFMAAGEYIRNANAATEEIKGWVVSTAGILAPAWLTSTVYVKGQLVTAGGNVYAANGSFTSGTTPSGTASNFADATASSIVTGDVATWDYIAPAAVLTADGVEAVTWANRGTGAFTGQRKRITDIGNASGTVMQWDGTYWKVTAPTDIVFDVTLATAATLDTNENILKQATLPAGILRAGRHHVFRMVFAKDGTTDIATCKLRIGTAGTTSDTQILSTASLTAPNQSMVVEIWGHMTSATSMRSTAHQNMAAGFSTLTAATNVYAATDKTLANIDSNALICSLSTTMNGSTNHGQVAHFLLELRP